VAFREFLADLRQDNVKDHGGKDGAEGATLGETFFLQETGPGAVWVFEPTGVGVTI
jgi:uncharacterized protein (AIM24 family)